MLRFLSGVIAIALTVFGEASGQQFANARADEWIRNINQNALPPHPVPAPFLPARPGPALYFCSTAFLKVPYLVFVPHNYDPSVPLPVVVFLHGAILARDSFQYANPLLEEEPVFSVADKYHVLVVFPFAQHNFAWPAQESANDAVLAIIGRVKKDYNVDDKKIFLGGISMGGNATLWFLKNRPGLFAGFYTVSARISNSMAPGDLEPLKTKPLCSINAEDDAVFSFADARKTFEKYHTEFPLWHFLSVPAGGHRFIYDGESGKLQLQRLIGMLLRP